VSWEGGLSGFMSSSLGCLVNATVPLLLIQAPACHVVLVPKFPEVYIPVSHALFVSYKP
jgi:hypothetical protein